MFERFTERARQVVVAAQEESRELRHPYIGPEHLLLGVLHEEDGSVAQACSDAGITLDEARDAVVRLDGMGDDDSAGKIPFTPHAKRALERSLREALRMSDNFIGTEHLVLGLLREDEALKVLSEVGAQADDLRERVLETRQARPERRRGKRANLGHDAQGILNRARELASEEGASEVGVEHLRRALEAPRDP